MVYCLLGILDISIRVPVIYGEGYENAMRRLRKASHEQRNNDETDDFIAERTVFDVEESVMQKFERKEREKEEKKREKLIESLIFDHIETRDNTIKRAVEHIRDWLLTSPKYQRWLDFNSFSKPHGLLWFKGKPGVGKSTLMKFACAHARKTMKRAYYSIAVFFNARGSTLERIQPAYFE